MKWKMKDGKEIEIALMSTEHIINTLNLIDRTLCNAQNRCYGFDDQLDIPEELQLQIQEMINELEIREKDNKKKRI